MGYDLEARKVKVLSTIIEQSKPRFLVYMGERRPRAKGERVTVVDCQNGKSFFVEKDYLVNRIASHLNVTQISAFNTEQYYKGPTEEK